MHRIYLTLLILILGKVLSAQNESIDPKLTAALTQQELSGLSATQLEYLTVLAHKLCYFQPAKDENMPIHDLKLKSGESVVLTPEQIEDFNPLLYHFPQQSDSCMNLLIQDTSGKKHLMVIRSAKMIDNEIKRNQRINQSKTGKK
jgi:hypothetical protein